MIYNELTLNGKTFAEAIAHVKKVSNLSPPLWTGWSEMQKVSLKVWPACQILNFTVVPLRLRVLYMNTCVFFWVIYLAAQLRKASAIKKDER